MKNEKKNGMEKITPSKKQNQKQITKKKMSDKQKECNIALSALVLAVLTFFVLLILFGLAYTIGFQSRQGPAGATGPKGTVAGPTGDKGAQGSEGQPGPPSPASFPFLQYRKRNSLYYPNPDPQSTYVYFEWQIQSTTPWPVSNGQPVILTQVVNANPAVKGLWNATLQAFSFTTQSNTIFQGVRITLTKVGNFKWATSTSDTTGALPYVQVFAFVPNVTYYPKSLEDFDLQEKEKDAQEQEQAEDQRRSSRSNLNLISQSFQQLSKLFSKF